MLHKLLKIGVGVLCLATLSARSSATVLTWSTILYGFNEVPPNGSPGVGFASGTLDDVTGVVIVTSGSFSGLVAPATAAHIHGLAPAGAVAGVLIPLTATPATSGTLTGSGVLSATNVAGMIAGLTYVNVHSAPFPAGEIRGQIAVTPVPEPASVLALLAGAGVLARRRRAHA